MAASSSQRCAVASRTRARGAAGTSSEPRSWLLPYPTLLQPAALTAHNCAGAGVSLGLVSHRVGVLVKAARKVPRAANNGRCPVPGSRLALRCTSGMVGNVGQRITSANPASAKSERRVADYTQTARCTAGKQAPHLAFRQSPCCSTSGWSTPSSSLRGPQPVAV